jgi:hypothetical protein
MLVCQSGGSIIRGIPARHCSWRKARHAINLLPILPSRPYALTTREAWETS